MKKKSCNPLQVNFLHVGAYEFVHIYIIIIFVNVLVVMIIFGNIYVIYIIIYVNIYYL